MQHDFRTKTNDSCVSLQQSSDGEYFDVDSDRDSLYQPDDVELGDGPSSQEWRN